MKLADGLTRMTGRLRVALADSGGALQSGISRFSNDIHKVADNLVTTDGRGARAVSRVDPDTPLFLGQSPRTGLLHSFTPDQIRSLPILDPDKKIVGVYFPSQLSDIKKPLIFTRDGLESVRRGYYQFTSGQEPHQPRWIFKRKMFPAPWGEETVFAWAHGKKNGYYVHIKKKIPFTKWSRWVPVRVNGETYGQILAADRNFKQAVKGAPTAELIQMSCSPAAGSAAPKSAESLNSAGIGFDVHADKKVYFYLDNFSEKPKPSWVKQVGDIITGHGSEMELDKSDNHTIKSPWVVYKASRPRPDTQD